MTAPVTSEEAEARAVKRYYVLGAIRIGSIACVIAGISIARTLVEAPYWLGVALAVGGMIGFFFAPPLLAKRWKAGDRERGEP
ncbi:MAG: hypothetical protein AAFQ27_06525 [Pseudomonadota bacterium]